LEHHDNLGMDHGPKSISGGNYEPEYQLGWLKVASCMLRKTIFDDGDWSLRLAAHDCKKQTWQLFLIWCDAVMYKTTIEPFKLTFRPVSDLKLPVPESVLDQLKSILSSDPDCVKITVSDLFIEFEARKTVQLVQDADTDTIKTEDSTMILLGKIGQGLYDLVFSPLDDPPPPPDPDERTAAALQKLLKEMRQALIKLST